MTKADGQPASYQQPLEPSRSVAISLLMPKDNVTDHFLVPYKN